MKRLVYLIVVVFNFEVAAQSFPVRNANEDYVVSNLYRQNLPDTLIKIVRDHQGLYWFLSEAAVFSFDGINWRTYKVESVTGKTPPARINDVEIMDDGDIWLATSDGIYVFNSGSENFIPIKKKFPVIKGLPAAVSYFYKILPGKLIFNSALDEGFYILDVQTKKNQQIIIDSTTRALIPGGETVKITNDQTGNVWGLTTDKRGIWKYNYATGKILCSWKGELPEFSGKRFQNVESLTYSSNENALWISHGTKGYLEKMNMQTLKSSFYSFNGNLRVSPDSVAKNKYRVYHVKIDNEGNEWVKVGTKYLVKLNKDIKRMEYMANDPDLLPIGDWGWFRSEDHLKNNEIRNDNILLWVEGKEKLSMIKKREKLVRHIPFDTLTFTGIKADDYINIDTHQTIFFEKGKNGQYFLFQQNAGRPKLVCLDKNLQIWKVLFNDEWKQYDAFFSQDLNVDTFYIAFMSPKVEPINFRNLVIKEFRVDLKTLKTEEVKLSFSDRIWRYGYADAHKVYWLFSNGTLYSFDPKKNILDSTYICNPAEKGSYRLELVKGFDYPVVLHKKSSTFWIDFIPKRELYKISLKTKKIERIFKCCTEKGNCDIADAIFDMYNFDTDRIYLQNSFSACLINPMNDSITYYAELFKNDLVSLSPMGSGLYKDWVCFVLPSRIYFLNTRSGLQKELTLNRDFKWKLSQFNSRPLVNDRGEMILMSSKHKGFLVFNIDSLPDAEKPGNVQLAFIKVDNKNLGLDSLNKIGKLSLKYNKYSSIHIGFSDHSIFDPQGMNYEYTLYKGGDTVWSKITGEPELTLSELSAGKYQLLLRAGNGFGDYSKQITAFSITILPPFRQTWWFRLMALFAAGLIFYGLYRYRVQQLNRLQTIRNNIASDLHDDIGSTLNSISIYSEVAKQQAGKDIPALDLIGLNSRKIIENMSDIVWTINPENDSFEKIIIRMRSFAYQLLKAKKVEYTFEVDEKLNSLTLPMQVRKNFYLVFKEAITNLIKYSNATRASISLKEENRIILLKIRDNGKGIPINAETQGNGLMNMKRRAEEIQASLNIISANGEGTGIELILKT